MVSFCPDVGRGGGGARGKEMKKKNFVLFKGFFFFPRAKNVRGGGGPL